MNKSWRFFIVVELLLFIFALWQMVSNIPLLILLTFGILNLVYVLRKEKTRTNFNNFQLVLGGFIVFICLVSTPSLWLMAIFAVLFIGLKGVEVSGISLTKHAFWRKKSMIMVSTKEDTPHSSEVHKNLWFGNQRIGNEVYEWQDINMNLISGDTIIDLGNTLLPKNDSIIIVRKGIGRTRVLVPMGVAIVLEHATLLGSVSFDEEHVSLRNETIKLYSSDYDDNPRRLKIITNSLVGDLEVIRV